MVIVKSLIDYEGSKSNEDETLEDCHTMDGGEEVPSDIAKQEKGKLPYTRKDKGKEKQREFMLELKCFLCDDSYLTSECHKGEALNALIREREKNEEARLGSI